MSHVRTHCVCRTKVIHTRLGVLNREPSPYGTYAAYRGGSGAWLARKLEQGQEPRSYEKRHALHECPT